MMKTKILWLCSLSTALAVEIPSNSQVASQVGPDGASVQISLTDPNNLTWYLQGTDDLAGNSWQNLGAWKVHNSRLQQSFPIPSGSTAKFYRMMLDPGLPSFDSQLATALILPATPFDYRNPVLPNSFLINPIAGQDNTPVTNPTTDTGAKLGRALFYDKRLSRNQTVSCSSCHLAEHGFSDPATFSRGFDGALTGRNSMGLTSARYYLRQHFFWDERANTLEDQVLMPIQDSKEMGMTLPDLITRLSAEPYYQSLFTETFGTATVTSGRISSALAQFVRSIVSTQTKYDAGVTSNFSNFTASENRGRGIFQNPTQGNCAACHGTDNFVPGPNINNNGLENPYIDKGLGSVTGRPQDEGLFKVGSLRNIEFTAPYMHDGRFATLEQVVDFYNAGVVNHPNLSPPLRNPPGTPGAGQPRRLNLNPGQKADLVAFLKTLTDPTIATNPKWSDPFNYSP